MYIRNVIVIRLRFSSFYQGRNPIYIFSLFSPTSKYINVVSTYVIYCLLNLRQFLTYLYSDPKFDLLIRGCRAGGAITPPPVFREFYLLPTKLTQKCQKSGKVKCFAPSFCIALSPQFLRHLHPCLS